MDKPLSRGTAACITLKSDLVVFEENLTVPKMNLIVLKKNLAFCTGNLPKKLSVL